MALTFFAERTSIKMLNGRIEKCYKMRARLSKFEEMETIAKVWTELRLPILNEEDCETSTARYSEWHSEWHVRNGVERSWMICAEAQIDCAIGSLYSKVNSRAWAEFSGAAKRILQESKTSIKRNSESVMKKAFRSRDITSARSDKSNRLDPNTYACPMAQHTDNYEEMKILLPVTLQAEFNKELNNIAKKYNGDLSTTPCNLKCSEPLSSVMRMLPKDHKKGPLQARPIVAAVDAPATKLFKFLSFFPFFQCLQLIFPPPRISWTLSNPRRLTVVRVLLLWMSLAFMLRSPSRTTLSRELLRSWSSFSRDTRQLHRYGMISMRFSDCV